MINPLHFPNVNFSNFVSWSKVKEIAMKVSAIALKCLAACAMAALVLYGILQGTVNYSWLAQQPIILFDSV